MAYIKHCQNCDYKYSTKNCIADDKPYCKNYKNSDEEIIIKLEKQNADLIKALEHFTNINTYSYGYDNCRHWQTMVNRNIKLARKALAKVKEEK